MFADADHDRLVLGHPPDGLPHGLAGQGAAAGAVDADDDRLDRVVPGHLPHGVADVVRPDRGPAAQPAEAAPAPAPSTITPSANTTATVGLVLTAGFRLVSIASRPNGLLRSTVVPLGGVVVEDHVKLRPQLVLHQLPQPVHVDQVVDEPPLLGVGRGHDRLVDGGLDLLETGRLRLAADAADDLVVEAVDELVDLALELLARAGAGELLVGPLVDADLDVVGDDAELVEQCP